MCVESVDCYELKESIYSRGVCVRKLPLCIHPLMFQELH